MEGNLLYQDCEMIGRFLDGNADNSVMAAIRNGMDTALCELVLVSIKAMCLISNERQ